MVHYKRNYGSFKDAIKHPDGLAVVAFLYEVNKDPFFLCLYIIIFFLYIFFSLQICESPNLGLNLIVDSLNKTQNKPGVKVPLKPFPVGILHSEIKKDYATYIGSLTTPPCTEAVTWIISSRSLPVSKKQVIPVVLR